MNSFIRIAFVLVAVAEGGPRLRAGDDLWPLVDSALQCAGDNAAQLRTALDAAPENPKEGVQFLIAHMPERDLRSLSAAFLLQNVRFAYLAWNEAPWKDRLSREMFLNDRAWFSGRAATAQPGHPRHAIFATSFKRTAVRFPLAWARTVDDVCAVDVTERYIERPGREQRPPAPETSSSGDVEASLHALAQLKKYLELAPAGRPGLAEQEFAAVALTREHAREAETRLWNDHVRRIKQTRAEEMQARQLTAGELQMPFFYTVSGDQPTNGRSLYISLHGGGGAPKRVNDRQWENQKRLFQVPEGVYLAPRAPTDTWNMWHQGHIDRLIDRLIENLIVFDEVDPNRVYLLGYSAGGDGVYQLAPRMADRFAAAAMMAGHPNEASPLGLRNVAFTIHAGGNDRLLNLDLDMTVTSQGKELFTGRMKRSIGTLAKTLAERGDPASIFSGEIAVVLPASGRSMMSDD